MSGLLEAHARPVSTTSFCPERVPSLLHVCGPQRVAGIALTHFIIRFQLSTGFPLDPVAQDVLIETQDSGRSPQDSTSGGSRSLLRSEGVGVSVHESNQVQDQVPPSLACSWLVLFLKLNSPHRISC